MTKQLHNLPHLKEYRRSLRSNLTSAEAFLWRYLKNSQLAGYKFRRQHSIGPYIADFYCPAARLVIELDGQAHDDCNSQANDFERDAYLKNLGIKVIRIENKYVFQQTERVLEEITTYLKS